MQARGENFAKRSCGCSKLAGLQLTRPNSWTKKAYHGLLNTGKAHLAEVMEVTLVGAWQNTWGNPRYA